VAKIRITRDAIEAGVTVVGPGQAPPEPEDTYTPPPRDSGVVIYLRPDETERLLADNSIDRLVSAIGITVPPNGSVDAATLRNIEEATGKDVFVDVEGD
jgi:hypothetical protein